MLAKYLSRFAVLLISNGHQQMLSRDKLVFHALCLRLCSSEDLTQPGAEILLATLDPEKARCHGLHVVKNDGHINGEFSQNRADDAFGLFEHYGQQMLRLNLLVLITFSKFD